MFTVLGKRDDWYSEPKILDIESESYIALSSL